MKNYTTSKYFNFYLYFLWLFIILLTINSWFFYFNHTGNVESYIISSILLLVMLYSLIRGTVSGLTTSLIIIFLYSTYLLLRQFILPWRREITIEELFWIPIIPIGAFISGKINDIFKSLKQRIEEIEYSIDELVTLDEETGLNNRKNFIFSVEEEIKRGKRYGGKFAIVLIKINFLKEFKDQYGESAKKRMIKMIAEKINIIFRLEDKKARLKEDEFGAILLEVDEDTLNIIKDRIKDNLSFIDIKIGEEKYKRVRLYINVGWAFFPKDGEDFSILYAKATHNYEFDME